MKSTECHHCGATVALQNPVTFEVQGYLFADHGFCGEACASAWSRSEVLRLRGWLRRIFTRCGGIAGRLARKALQTNLQITDDV